MVLKKDRLLVIRLNDHMTESLFMLVISNFSYIYFECSCHVCYFLTGQKTRQAKFTVFSSKKEIIKAKN